MILQQVFSTPAKELANRWILVAIWISKTHPLFARLLCELRSVQVDNRENKLVKTMSKQDHALLTNTVKKKQNKHTFEPLPPLSNPSFVPSPFRSSRQCRRPFAPNGPVVPSNGRPETCHLCRAPGLAVPEGGIGLRQYLQVVGSHFPIYFRTV